MDPAGDFVRGSRAARARVGTVIGMRLSFFGAAGEVTGSCYLLETERARVLIDFGIFQGGRDAERRNRRMPPIRPESLDAIVLTHAHLDHTGRLPLLAGACPRPRRSSGVRCGAPIWATPATIDLTGILLRDAAHIQEMDAERTNRRRAAEGKPPVTPLYTTPDVDRVLGGLRPLGFDEAREIAPGVTCRLTGSGHILGAASVELSVRQGDASRTIVFSGDIGPRNVPLLKDPVPPDRADVIVLESTYGDRDHRPRTETVAEFHAATLEARVEQGGGGKVLIPTFAVGRTQELIYELGCLRREEVRRRNVQDTDLPGVYVDSPLAIEATALYSRHHGLFDEDSAAVVRAGQSPLAFPGLRFTRTREQSEALNSLRGGVIVMAGAGMCTGGRILHHLKHGLADPRTHVVFVGFQAEGTLGRRLVDGHAEVRVFESLVAVRARVHTLGGFSAHAGQTELVRWASHVRAARPGQQPRVYLTHGENLPRAALRTRLANELGIAAELPTFGASVDL